MSHLCQLRKAEGSVSGSDLVIQSERVGCLNTPFPDNAKRQDSGVLHSLTRPQPSSAADEMLRSLTSAERKQIKLHVEFRGAAGNSFSFFHFFFCASAFFFHLSSSLPVFFFSNLSPTSELSVENFSRTLCSLTCRRGWICWNWFQ